jgi:hypothetical protein
VVAHLSQELWPLGGYWDALHGLVLVIFQSASVPWENFDATPGLISLRISESNPLVFTRRVESSTLRMIRISRRTAATTNHLSAAFEGSEPDFGIEDLHVFAHTSSTFASTSRSMVSISSSHLKHIGEVLRSLLPPTVNLSWLARGTIPRAPPTLPSESWNPHCVISSRGLRSSYRGILISRGRNS